MQTRDPDAIEINFDGLPGPTHHYAGLARGNVASMMHAHQTSNPRAAALQSLAKMRLHLQLGLKQGIFLPQRRPYLDQRFCQYSPQDLQIALTQLYQQNPAEFCAHFSASDMWAANAATMTPSADAIDKLIHLTPANLISHPHRHFEAQTRYEQLQKIFQPPFFKIHAPLTATPEFSDEGAANHFRLTSRHGAKGINVFIYGKNGPKRPYTPAKIYQPRQSMKASAAIAQQHRIGNYVLFFQQNPKAIDTGVFHNDVVTISNENCILFHEEAFLEGNITSTLAAHCHFPLYTFMISEKDMPLTDAIRNYFFNSQLVTIKRQQMALIMPQECQNDPSVERVLRRLDTELSPIRQYHYIDCSQSMQNGGGPACLRLRINVTERELSGIDSRYLLDSAKVDTLEACVKQHYRDRVTPEDFLDPNFREECQKTYSALEQVLGI